MRRRKDLLASATVLLVAGAFGGYRRWHLRWGASRDERDAAMAGDEVLPVAQFTATRAITIDAPPSRVWPWPTQVGAGRAGFYSYDLIDNRGHRSSDRIPGPGSESPGAASGRRHRAEKSRIRCHPDA